MITIRPLIGEDMQAAIELKVQCWTEELAGIEENTLSVKAELDFWLEWMNSAQEHNDIRLLIGAFENKDMLGVAFASLAEADDIPSKGIELNGLWVSPEHRGCGVSLRLMVHVLDYYRSMGMERIVIYNCHHAPSNAFYRKFGAQVMRQVNQMQGKLPVDVFIADVGDLYRRMSLSLSRMDAIQEQVKI